MDRNYFDLKGQVTIVTGCSGGLGVQMAVDGGYTCM